MASDLTFTGERFVPGLRRRNRVRALASLRIRAPVRRRQAGARRRLRRRLRHRLAGGRGAPRRSASTSTPADRHARRDLRRARRIRFVEGSCTGAAAAGCVGRRRRFVRDDRASGRRRPAADARRIRAGAEAGGPADHLVAEQARSTATRATTSTSSICTSSIATTWPRCWPRRSRRRRWFHQRVSPWSAIWSGARGRRRRGLARRRRPASSPYVPPEGMYFIVVAARSAALAVPVARGSLLTDADDTEQKRDEANAREVLRLDALLRDRDAALDRQTRTSSTSNGSSLSAIASSRRGTRCSQELERGTRGSGPAARRRAPSNQRVSRSARLPRSRASRTGSSRRCVASELTVAYRQSARWWVRCRGSAPGSGWRAPADACCRPAPQSTSSSRSTTRSMI